MKIFHEHDIIDYSRFWRGDIMDQKKIDRINELARKSKTTGLTENEKEEQKLLRNEYRMSVTGNLAAQLNNTYIMTPDGKKRKLRKNG